MKDDSYVVILPFMVRDLKLKGAELIAYAIIHSFTMAGQTFNGGTKYLMEWTATNSKPNILRVLKSLTDKGLLNKVEKTINGVKFCEYTTVVLKENQGGSEIEPGVVLKQNQGGSKTEPNNKDNNKTDIKEDSKKYIYGEFQNIELTDDELQKLKDRFPSTWERWIESASEYIASTGKKYKSHYATILNWARKEEQKGKPIVEKKEYGKVWR